MDRKTARLCLRITPSDKKAIVAKARNLHLSTADWLIRSALDREIIPPRSVWDAQSINQLSRIGNNLNQLAHWANCGVHIWLCARRVSARISGNSSSLLDFAAARRWSTKPRKPFSCSTECSGISRALLLFFSSLCGWFRLWLITQTPQGVWWIAGAESR